MKSSDRAPLAIVVLIIIVLMNFIVPDSRQDEQSDSQPTSQQDVGIEDTFAPDASVAEDTAQEEHLPTTVESERACLESIEQEMQVITCIVPFPDGYQRGDSTHARARFIEILDAPRPAYRVESISIGSMDDGEFTFSGLSNAPKDAAEHEVHLPHPRSEGLRIMARTGNEQAAPSMAISLYGEEEEWFWTDVASAGN